MDNFNRLQKMDITGWTHKRTTLTTRMYLDLIKNKCKFVQNKQSKSA